VTGDHVLYDRIGSGYARTRRPDPRIAAAVDAALGDARTVVNVGAGTGNYEPRDREVTAVEPSREMIEQRPPDAAPAVLASAEELPFPDDSFDAALASMTVHHWRDIPRGLSEMRRVTRERVVILTWDPSVASGAWLGTDYLPEIMALEVTSFPGPEELGEMLGGAELRPVPVPRDCTDGFLEAFWARPEMLLDPAVREGMSVMALLGEEVVRPALARLEADLRSGEWDRRHGHLRELAELDLGYRLVVATQPPAPSAAAS
jgi:SAM-dependent methyltransferase